MPMLLRHAHALNCMQGRTKRFKKLVKTDQLLCLPDSGRSLGKACQPCSIWYSSRNPVQSTVRYDNPSKPATRAAQRVSRCSIPPLLGLPQVFYAPAAMCHASGHHSATFFNRDCE